MQENIGKRGCKLKQALLICLWASLPDFWEQFLIVQHHWVGVAWSTQYIFMYRLVLSPMWGDPHSNILPLQYRASKGHPRKQQQYFTKSLKQILFYFSCMEIKHTLNSIRPGIFTPPFKAWQGKLISLSVLWGIHLIDITHWRKFW